MPSQRTLKLSEVVKTVELEDIEVPDGDTFRFRVEILRQGPSQYSARVWRVERYHIAPTFPLNKRPRYSCDELLMIRDPIASNVAGRTVRQVLDHVLNQIHETFHAVLEPARSTRAGTKAKPAARPASSRRTKQSKARTRTDA